MISKTLQPISSTLVSVALFLSVALGKQAHAFQDQPPPQTSAQPSSSSAAPAVAPLTSDELDALVAPIALYPDALVAQVLGAATFPDQIAIADYWVGQNKNLTGTALAQAVDQQSWDPSVKALTQFPAVLNNLAGNLAWTSNIGQAFQNQQADVMAAVQTMRAKAQAAGTLQSTSQVKVVQQTPQTIVIQPANPQVVYVPEYNPTIVYGSPYVVPLYTPPVAVAAATVSFGVGIAVGEAFSGGGGGGGFGFGWGFHSWNCNWGGGGGGNVVFNHTTYIHNTYINNRTNYNGYHPWGPVPHGPSGPNGPHPYAPNGGGFRPNGGPNGDRPVPTRDQPNGGRNGDRGLIGGNGGVQHQVGGNGHPASDRQPAAQRSNNDPRPNRNNGDRFRSPMSGNGGAARAEANRGRSSMHPTQRPAMRQAAMHTRGPQRGGGRR
jgi:hypothetical protein